MRCANAKHRALTNLFCYIPWYVWWCHIAKRFSMPQFKVTYANNNSLHLPSSATGDSRFGIFIRIPFSQENDDSGNESQVVRKSNSSSHQFCVVDILNKNNTPRRRCQRTNTHWIFIRRMDMGSGHGQHEKNIKIDLNYGHSSLRIISVRAHGSISQFWTETINLESICFHLMRKYVGAVLSVCIFRLLHCLQSMHTRIISAGGVCI